MIAKRCTKYVGALLALCTLLGAAGCGGQPGPQLSAEAQIGKELAGASGCAGCHGSNGRGGAGPAWVGLYRSEVELDDGTTVIADESYLKRAISDPEADRVGGYTIKMPANQLTDSEIQSVLTYIKELG